MKLTQDNYFSAEASQKYMGSTQFKTFMECPARAMAQIRGEWRQKTTDALLVGSYIHAWNAGTQDEFKSNNPEIFKKNGELKANFLSAHEAIDAVKNDVCMSFLLKGEKEVIITAEAFGTPWKIMIDSYNPAQGFFSDLKYVKSITKDEYNNDSGRYESFIVKNGYHYQMSIYARIEQLATGRSKPLRPQIIAVSKEDPPDKAAFYFNERDIEETIEIVKLNLPKFLKIKRGEEEATRCEQCSYCRATKKIKEIVHYSSAAQKY